MACNCEYPNIQKHNEYSSWCINCYGVVTTCSGVNLRERLEEALSTYTDNYIKNFWSEVEDRKKISQEWKDKLDKMYREISE